MFLRFAAILVVVSFFLNTTRAYAQIELPDSLGPPMPGRDTIRVTKSVRKVPPVFSNRQIKLQNKIAKDVPQIALPADFSATFVDSAWVNHEHVTALEDYFTALVESPSDSSLFDVVLPDTVLHSIAWVKAWAWQLANLRLREQYIFQSADERKSYKEAVEKNFRRKIDIEVLLRSVFASAIHLDTAAQFRVYIDKSPVKVPPQAIRYGPVNTRFAAGIIYYERVLTLEFPRFVNARDYWRSNTIHLIIEPRSNSNTRQGKSGQYRFVFHAPRIK
jgi:hypothetical protein